MKSSTLLLVSFISFAACAYAAPEAAAPVPEITAGESAGTSLSIFNDGLALVREVRQAELGAGVSRLKVTGVPSTLIPESVRVKSQNTPEGFTVTGQVFEQNTADAGSLLDRFVGKKIKVVNWNQYQDRKETVEAVLLSNYGEPVYLIGEEVHIGHPGTKILPHLPEGFVFKPELKWEASAKAAGPQELEITYLASGIRWQADYVLLMPESGPAELTAWATLSNDSGTAFHGASLRLVAGQVNRTYAEQPRMYAMSAKREVMMDAAAAPAPSFQHQDVFEYHAYDLSVPVDLEHRSRAQIPFFDPKSVTLEREYRVEAAQHYYGQPYAGTGDGTDKQPVQVYVKMKNEEASGLGLPLPEGTVRLYARDASGRQTFAGEDRVLPTPKGETVRINAGRAFDLTAARRQTDYRQTAANTFESEWEVKIGNAKAEDVTVLVTEPMSGSWEVLSSSLPHEKLNAGLIQFTVKVPKQGEAVLKYRVRTGY
jgi:hypothetical protein